MILGSFWLMDEVFAQLILETALREEMRWKTWKQWTRADNFRRVTVKLIEIVKDVSRTYYLRNQGWQLKLTLANLTSIKTLSRSLFMSYDEKFVHRDMNSVDFSDLIDLLHVRRFDDQNY